MNINTFEDSEIFIYWDYIDYIKEVLIGGLKDQLKISGIILPEDIHITKIKKNSPNWTFHYQIMHHEESQSLTDSKSTEPLFEGIYFTSELVSFDEWLRLKQVDDRDRKIDQLLEGLSPIHAEKLKGALKDKK